MSQKFGILLISSVLCWKCGFRRLLYFCSTFKISSDACSFRASIWFCTASISSMISCWSLCAFWVPSTCSTRRILLGLAAAWDMVNGQILAPHNAYKLKNLQITFLESQSALDLLLHKWPLAVKKLRAKREARKDWALRFPCSIVLPKPRLGYWARTHCEPWWNSCTIELEVTLEYFSNVLSELRCCDPQWVFFVVLSHTPNDFTVSMPCIYRACWPVGVGCSTRRQVAVPTRRRRISPTERR